MDRSVEARVITLAHYTSLNYSSSFRSLKSFKIQGPKQDSTTKEILHTLPPAIEKCYNDRVPLNFFRRERFWSIVYQLYI